MGAPPTSRDSMNELSRFESELAEDEDEDEDDDEADDDEHEPVELGTALILADGLWMDRAAADDDEVEAAMAARMNGAFMTVSTLEARK